LLGGVSAGQHISEVSNASRTLLLNIRTLEWDPVLLQFFGIRVSVLPRLVSTSEVYGYLSYGPLKGVPLGGLVGDQHLTHFFTLFLFLTRLKIIFNRLVIG
jgi:glycerol kinase